MFTLEGLELPNAEGLLNAHGEGGMGVVPLFVCMCFYASPQTQRGPGEA